MRVFALSIAVVAGCGGGNCRYHYDGSFSAATLVAMPVVESCEPETPGTLRCLYRLPDRPTWTFHRSIDCRMLCGTRECTATGAQVDCGGTPTTVPPLEGSLSSIALQCDGASCYLATIHGPLMSLEEGPSVIGPYLEQQAAQHGFTPAQCHRHELLYMCGERHRTGCFY